MTKRPDETLVPQDELSRYFAEIARYPLLSRKKEIELATRVQAGDAEAAQTLVVSNLRLVVKIAREYERVWTNLLDLIQEARRRCTAIPTERPFSFSLPTRTPSMSNMMAVIIAVYLRQTFVLAYFYGVTL